MKVQVTKDSWGVQIWFDWVELEYGDLGQVLNPENAPTGGPIWLPTKTYWFKKKKVFTDKHIKEFFPDLNNFTVPDLKCSECSEEMEFDGREKKYFMFLKRSG